MCGSSAIPLETQLSSKPKMTLIHVHGVHDTCMKVLCTNPECRIYIASLGRLPNLLTRYFKPEDFCITHKGANVMQLLANFMTIRPQENLSINPDILIIVLEPRGFGDIFNGKPSTKLFGFHFFDLQPGYSMFI